MSSPRPWGCFLSDQLYVMVQNVFPTPVGVFPMTFRTTSRHAGLPHARGGVSSADSARAAHRRSSPRPWGCFFRPFSHSLFLLVFPTPVGVFLSPGCFQSRKTGLPHARGGVSMCTQSYFISLRSSPRPWGCFYFVHFPGADKGVFPTPVGVFLISCGFLFLTLSLPHARGGVSYVDMILSSYPQSSPRPWGVFLFAAALEIYATVFPTPVGVFPPSKVQARINERLPHARGGVSHQNARIRKKVTSSPRPWGCFQE